VGNVLSFWKKCGRRRLSNLSLTRELLKLLAMLASCQLLCHSLLIDAAVIRLSLKVLF